MKVSIITVTYNSAHTLKDCIHSVSSQSYDNIEHIFIDGNSTDNTVEIIKNHAPGSVYISETDRGLFDAMNKGLKLATGDLIGILNSDDMYAYSNVIRDTVELIADKDALYADLCYVDRANSEKLNAIGNLDLTTELLLSVVGCHHIQLYLLKRVYMINLVVLT